MFAGLGGSPVTKGILLSTAVTSAVLHATDPEGNFNVTLDVWRVLTEGEFWRLISCHTVCTSMGSLVATSLSLYRLRGLEPLFGSKKFGAFAAVTPILALPFEATAGVYFGHARLTPGPLPLVFALLVVYYAVVPPLKPRCFGAFGMDFSDKTFTFCVAFMLACSEGWASLVPAVCGSLVGGFYVMDTMSIQSVRLPKLIYWAFSKLCRPFARSPRRGGGSNGGGVGGLGSGTRAVRRTRSAQPLLGPAEGGWNGRGNLFSFLTQQQQGQGSTRLRNASATLPPPPSPPPPSEETVTALTGMGFDRASVLQALQHTGNNSFAAANHLVSRAGAGGVSAGGGETTYAGGGDAGGGGEGGAGSTVAAPHHHSN